MVRWEAWLPCHLLSNFIFWLPHISWRVSSIIFWKLINFRQRLFPVFVDTYFSPADRNPWHWVVKMPNQGWVCLGDTGKGTLSRPGWDRAEGGEDRGPAASRPALPPGHGPFPGSQEALHCAASCPHSSSATGEMGARQAGRLETEGLNQGV